MSDFTHLVISRINCEYPVDSHYPPQLYERIARMRFDPEWMKKRIEYLQKYTVPSLKAQTNKDFKWLILAHIDSPDWFKDEFRQFDAEVCFIPSSPREYLPMYIQDEVTTPWVITTTVDSDDAVCHDFIKTIQENFDHKKEYLNTLKGYKYVLETGRFYGQKSESNPFISLVEKTEEAKGIYVRVHGAAHLYAPVKQIDNREPMWVQVCHGDNVLNKARLRKKHAGRAYDDVKKHVTMQVGDGEG